MFRPSVSSASASFYQKYGRRRQQQLLPPQQQRRGRAVRLVFGAIVFGMACSALFVLANTLSMGSFSMQRSFSVVLSSDGIPQFSVGTGISVGTRGGIPSNEGSIVTAAGDSSGLAERDTIRRRRDHADPALLDAVRAGLTRRADIGVNSSRESACTHSVFEEDQQRRTNSGGAAAPSDELTSHYTFLHKLESKLCSLNDGGEARPADAASSGRVTVIVTFANYAYRDMAHNFVMTFEETGVRQILVGALDEQMEQYVEDTLNLTAVRIDEEDGLMERDKILSEIEEGQLMVDGKSSEGTGNFRGNGMAFTNMGVKKGAFIRAVLSLGFDVIVSDTDVVWKRNPIDFFSGALEGYAHNGLADMLVTSDCFSGEYDMEFRRRGAEFEYSDDEPLIDGKPWYMRVGSRPGEINGNCLLTVFNTGVLFFRATDAARTFADEWIRNMMTGGAYQLGKTREEFGEHILDDQTCLNSLVRDGLSGDDESGNSRLKNFVRPLKLVHGGGGHLFWAFNGGLKMGYLPLHLFANGYTHFVERLSERFLNDDGTTGVVPFSVHATTTFSGYAGKVSRFRSDNSWLVDDEGRVEKQKYLALDMRREDYPAQAFDTSLSLIERHMWAMTHNLNSLRNGFAVAKALGRTLVLPSMLCFCDRYFNNVLPYCRVPGSSLELPFQCVLDQVIQQVAKLDLNRAEYPYEAIGFLENPRLPESIRRSQRVVLTHGDIEDVSTMADAVGKGNAVHLRVPLYPTDSEVKEALDGQYGDAPIVELRSPSTSFCTFDAPEESEAFDLVMNGKTEDTPPRHGALESRWCCWFEGNILVDYPKRLRDVDAASCKASREATSAVPSPNLHNEFIDTPLCVNEAARAMEYIHAHPEYVKRTFGDVPTDR